MESTFADLKNLLAEHNDLSKIVFLLNWDQATMMPSGGGGLRGHHLATLTRIQHEKFTADEVGALLDQLQSYEAALPMESDEASLIRVARSDWEKSRRIPTELAGEMSMARVAGQQAWIAARKYNDFASFLPFLERNLELKQRYIACYPDFDEPYDALIDDFERGLTAADIRPIFTRVRDGLVPLVKRVSDRADRVDNAPMFGHFPAELQKELGERVIANWGYNSGQWRLDPTAHPFATSIAIDDIRITTRYNEEYLAQSFFGTLHETGHGLYEHGVSKSLMRSPLCRGASSALHESQSRMVENLVGRNRPFWDYAFPIAKEIFPDHFAKYDAETVYRSVNKMGPSLIRVEADELTYSLHIIIRFEIEQELINRTLKAADLPEAWAAKMKEYLGIEVPNDSDGVLQDIHWSEALIGYFPTYALGTIIASQIWLKIQQDIPDLDAQISVGNFGPLRLWLVEHLHRYGRKFTPKETLRLVAGGPIDPEPYLIYLESKVTSLYGPAR